jgi:hypothetical protein
MLLSTKKTKKQQQQRYNLRFFHKMRSKRRGKKLQCRMKMQGHKQWTQIHRRQSLLRRKKKKAEEKVHLLSLLPTLLLY